MGRTQCDTSDTSLFRIHLVAAIPRLGFADALVGHRRRLVDLCPTSPSRDIPRIPFGRLDAPSAAHASLYMPIIASGSSLTSSVRWFPPRSGVNPSNVPFTYGGLSGAGIRHGFWKESASFACLFLTSR